MEYNFFVFLSFLPDLWKETEILVLGMEIYDFFKLFSPHYTSHA